MRRIYQPERQKHMMTERRKRILQFCHQYAQATGWAASHEEIKHAVGITSNNVMYSNMRALRNMGYIDWNGTRQIKVLWLP